jgi:hypothetical protein
MAATWPNAPLDPPPAPVLGVVLGLKLLAVPEIPLADDEDVLFPPGVVTLYAI